MTIDSWYLDNLAGLRALGPLFEFETGLMSTRAGQACIYSAAIGVHYRAGE